MAEREQKDSSVGDQHREATRTELEQEIGNTSLEDCRDRFAALALSRERITEEWSAFLQSPLSRERSEEADARRRGIISRMDAVQTTHDLLERRIRELQA
ncbi:MAG: hypothetical protein V1907_00790 [Candidatus Kerfeldbacteria bacterium]